MGKAKKEIKSKLTFDSKFNIKIPNKLSSFFEKELKRGELNLSLEMHYDDFIGLEEIYTDQFKDGGLIFEKVSNELYTVEVKGYVHKNLDSEFDSELIKFLQKNGRLDILTNSIGDNNSNQYYVDGDEDKKIIVGYISVDN